MRETDEDLERLQALLERSFDRSGEHLRSAFGQEHRLSAASLVDRLPGLFEMHFAVIAADGAPLVAPVDGFVLRGKICLGLPAPAVRARLVRRDPRVSASFKRRRGGLHRAWNLRGGRRGASDGRVVRSNLA